MRKLAKLWLLVVACLVSLAAHSQVVAISQQVINQYGAPLPYAQVRVCSVTSTGVPCTPTAAIYQDFGLTIPSPNPLSADQYGNFTAFAPALPAPNLYTVQYSPASGITWAYVVNGPGLSASGGTVTGYINALGYNGVPEADQCSGVDANAKINTCAAMIPNGGYEDARGFGSTTQTSTTALTALSLPTRPITLELNPATVYIENVAFSPGSIAAGTACIIPIAQGSAIETLGFNEAWNIRLGSSAATYDVVCNATQNGTQESMRIDGLGIQGNQQATMAGSLLHLKNIFAGTQIKDVNTYAPFGTALTDEGGSDHFYVDDNFEDGSPVGGYAGAVVSLICPNNITFQNGAIQFNGINNPLLTMVGYSPTGACTNPGSNAVGVHFYNVDFETQAATVGTFSGAPTNVDPIQITDGADVVLDKLFLYGVKGAGQVHIVDIMSSGANGQSRGPVEINNLQAGPQWTGISLIHNTVGSPYVSPELADVVGNEISATEVGIGKYRWAGNGYQYASVTDYEDFKNFSSMTAGITNNAYSPIYTNLATAMGAAGTTGSVLIPGNYTGTDGFCTISGSGATCSTSPNPHGLYVEDMRPKYLPQVPKNEIYASDFGAVCNGGTNDTGAIQAAINTAVWAYNLPTTTMAENEVVLPQGTCLIVSPLKFTGFHGSMVGAGNDATYLVGDFGSWVGTDYTVLELTATGAQPGGASVGVRRFSDFAIIGIGNSGVVSTLIKVLNTSNQYLVSYSLANIDFEHLLLAQADTCVDFEDMSNSQMQFNQIQNCRIGLQLNGNVQNNYFEHNTIDAGLLNYTSNTGNTTGLNVIQNTKYGGGSEQPQGVYFNNNSIENWYEGILDEECIACRFSGNQVDLITGIDMQIDENGVGGYGIWVDHNEFGMNTTTGMGMLIAAIADTPTPRNLGFWIEDNQFQLDNYPTNLPSTNIGMSFQGVVPLVNAHITGNQCLAMSVCIVMEQNLYDSVITDNFATDALTNVINLAGASSLVHTNTIVDHNLDYYDSITAVNVGSSTGAIIGYNCSASGCTTPTWPSLGNKVYTVSTLPAASGLPAGTQLVVSDAATFTPGTCTGSGSDYMIAITNGSSWSCH
jgi:hypothetical protein